MAAAAIFTTVVVVLSGCSKADPPRVQYRCGSLSEDGTMFDNVEEARTSGLDLCVGVFAKNFVLHQTEKQALLLAYGTDQDSSGGLATLYGTCAQRTTTILADYPTPMSTQQAAELRGALLLCPDHPDRRSLESAASQA